MTNTHSDCRRTMATVGLVLTGLAAAPAIEPASAAQYLVEGVGNSKCSDFTAASDENGSPYQEDQQWIAGFISGYNNALIAHSHDSNIGKGTDVNATMKLIYNYCSQYPNDDLTDAGSALMKYFKKGGK
ncbi:MAG TPA: hypothetical protein VN821_05875 [Candidatus Udaeobacter sp.]|nr:hypothetical protein [Candidatus Udaeobacter sp.]